jgi:hypothetical protein
MPEGPRGRIISGARARLLVDGNKFGYVTGLNINQTGTIEGVRPIDTIFVEELVVVGMDVDWSAAKVAVLAQPEMGDIWFGTVEELLAGGKELTMQVLDTISGDGGTVLFSLQHVKTATLTWSVEGRTLATQNVTGQARVAIMETQPDLVVS